MFKRNFDRRDDSVIKSIDCSYRGPGFGSQHPHSDSQPSIIPFQGIQHPLLTFMGIRHTYYTQTYMQAKYLCIPNNKIIFNDSVYLGSGDSSL